MEAPVSQRNGDKARFDRLRKKKAVHRDRMRELRKQLASGREAPVGLKSRSAQPTIPASG